jgi:hypothetical protein
MAQALVTAFLDAKMQNPKTSVALYAISADVDGLKIARRMGDRITNAIVELLSSAREPLAADPQILAYMLQGAMAGVSRRLLELEQPERHVETFRQELILFVSAYLEASSVNRRVEATAW